MDGPAASARDGLGEEDRAKVFEHNARKVYPRLDAHLRAQEESA